MKIERLIEQAREELITDIVLSDEFMNRMQENFLPIERLMSYYRCAIMEVQTPVTAWLWILDVIFFLYQSDIVLL